MLRMVVLVLVLLNSAYFAWSQGWLLSLGYGPTQQREPQRLSQQIRPEALVLVPSQAAGSDGAATPVAARAAECLQAGVFDEAQSQVLRAALADWPADAWVLQKSEDGLGTVLRLPAVNDTLRPRLDALAPALAGQALEPCL